MWDPEHSCEAGVPLVLADEILVCSKQQQGHFLFRTVSFTQLLDHSVMILWLLFNFANIFCLEGL